MAFDAWSPKDPADILDYTINWTNLLVGGETISTSVWAVTPSGQLTVGTTAISTPNTSAFLSLGNAGQQYAVKNTITTSASHTYERTVLIDVENL